MSFDNDRIPEDVAELISAHALGVGDTLDAQRAERHIARSEACRRAYEDALETASALALIADEAEPPAALRERILVAARAELPPPRPALAVARRRRSFAFLSPSRGLALAGCAAALVATVIAVDQNRAAGRNDKLVSVLASADARSLELGSAGRLVVARKGVVLVSRLGRAASGRTYQAWALSASGDAVSLGTFAGGSGATVVLPESARGAATIAITNEPSGGSPQPTSKPLAAAQL